jgi:hypothetical protein
MLVVLSWSSAKAFAENSYVERGHFKDFANTCNTVGIEDVAFDRVFPKRGSFFEKKKKGSILSSTPPSPWGHLKSQYLPSITRIKERAAKDEHPIVVAMGDVAFWALTGLTLSDYRGTVVRGKDYNVIGTFGITEFFNDWTCRKTVAYDLLKAQTGVVDLPVRNLHLIETVEDLKKIPHSLTMAVDVETVASQIECMSFSTDPHNSYIIPIWDTRKEDNCYWSKEDEIKVWHWVFDLMVSRDIRKIFHNALYDLSYFRHTGIPVRGSVDDTMLLHHSEEPEMRKGLGYLASIYLQESAWKVMNKKTKKTVNKKEA